MVYEEAKGLRVAAPQAHLMARQGQVGGGGIIERGAAELAPGFAADVCDGVSAVLRGARPDVSLRALVAVTPPPAFTEAHDRLAAYLECGETGLLLEAVEAVRAALRDDDALASSDEDAAALATPRLSLCA